MKRVIDFLKKHYVTTIATCSDNKPRASVVEYYVIGDSIIFNTSPGSIKAHNLNLNNRISMSVYEMPICVTIDGVVAKPTQTEIEGFNTIFLEKYPGFQDVEEPLVHYKIVIETAYYSDFTNGEASAEIIKA